MFTTSLNAILGVKNRHLGLKVSKVFRRQTRQFGVGTVWRDFWSFPGGLPAWPRLHRHS